MDASKKRALSYRMQAMIIAVVVAGWYLNWWISRRTGARAPVITEVLFWALPILSAVLSYLIVDTRMRSGQRADIWFYVGMVSGLLPWVSICM